MNEIKIKLMSDGAKMPTLATDGSAAYDLYTSEDFLIKRGRCALPTDVALEMPRNIKANVRARSGFSVKGFEAYAYVLDKNGNRVISDMPERINADVVLGLVDSDFRNAIKVIVKSDDDRTMLVPKGTRVA